MSVAANLTVIKDGLVVKTCSIEGDLILGRSKESAIRLDDHSVSRQHALFKWVGDNLQVEKKSEFGSLLLNGADCVSARLNHADVLMIGPYLIKVSLNAAEKSTEAAEAGKSSVKAPHPSLEDPAEGLQKSDDSSSHQELSLDAGSPSESIDLGLGENSQVPPEEGNSSQAPENPFEGGQGDDLSSDSNSLNAEAVLSESSANSELEVSASELIADDGKTKFTPSSTVTVRLIFEEGTANVTEYAVTKDETSIGRGKDCDIILNDKKASRKNSVIRKAGLNFLIKDLDSSNGTLVNGVKIKEAELAGDDIIKIGGVQFQFKAESAEYLKNQNNFISVDSVPEQSSFDLSVPEEGMEVQSDLLPDELPQAGDPNSLDVSGGAGNNPSDGLGSVPGMNSGSPVNAQLSGITGIDGGSGKKRTLYSRFKELPKRTQIIAAVLMVLVFLFLTDDDSTGTKKKNTGKKAAASKTDPANKSAAVPASFDSLNAEQKRFVEAQHTLAFDYYKNKEYDKCLFEIAKIFALIPDYKDAREIERYAKEGKRKLEALEEERKKKEEEAQLKDKINHLLEDAKIRMDKKEYEQMNDLFTQILALDPDNATVAVWRKQIEAAEEDRKQLLQQKEVLAIVNKSALEIYKEGLKEKKEGKYHTAIHTFQRAIDMKASLKKVSLLAKAEIKKCRSLIQSERDPVLAEAKASEEAGELTKAFNLYKQATHIDPPHPAGYAGMNRIRGILHDRAKTIYTEAIIAESYSDFANAKKMFQECLLVSPVDDIYHERAARKLSHYFEKREPAQQ